MQLRTFPLLSTTAPSNYALLGAYRFDDPAGDVGIECHLIGLDSETVAHVPLTYRGAPAPEAEEWLTATMEHSVLGSRWIYDACGDPVYVQELVRAVLTGGSHVEQFVATDSGPVLRPSTAAVSGSGVAGAPVPTITSVRSSREGNDTVIRAAGLEIVVHHAVSRDTANAHGMTLSGTWPGVETPRVLAYLR